MSDQTDKGIATALLLAVGGAVALHVLPSVAVGERCTCNDYVSHAVPGYPIASATELEDHALKAAGFTRLSSAEPGAIVLVQGQALPGTLPEGHVELVQAVDREGVQVATSGLNIPNGLIDAGCPNVAIVKRPELLRRQAGVSYWKRY